VVEFVLKASQLSVESMDLYPQLSS